MLSTFIILQILFCFSLARYSIEKDYELVGAILYIRHENKGPLRYLDFVEAATGLNFFPESHPNSKAEPREVSHREIFYGDRKTTDEFINQELNKKMTKLGNHIANDYKKILDAKRKIAHQIDMTYTEKMRSFESLVALGLGLVFAPVDNGKPINFKSPYDLEPREMRDDRSHSITGRPNECKRYTNELNALKAEKTHVSILKMRQFVKNNVLEKPEYESKQYGHLTSKVDLNDVATLQLIVGSIPTLREGNYSVPNWANDKKFLNEMMPAFYQGLWLTSCETTALMQAIVGPLMLRISNMVENLSRNKQHPTLSIHVGHEIAIFCLVAALSPTIATNKTPILSVGYGGTLATELYRKKLNGSYFVKISFASNFEDFPKRKDIRVEGCGGSMYCPLKDFSQLVDKFIPTNREKLCESEPFDYVPTESRPIRKDKRLVKFPCKPPLVSDSLPPRGYVVAKKKVSSVERKEKYSVESSSAIQAYNPQSSSEERDKAESSSRAPVETSASTPYGKRDLTTESSSRAPVKTSASTPYGKRDLTTESSSRASVETSASTPFGKRDLTTESSSRAPVKTSPSTPYGKRDLTTESSSRACVKTSPPTPHKKGLTTKSSSEIAVKTSPLKPYGKRDLTTESSSRARVKNSQPTPHKQGLTTESSSEIAVKTSLATPYGKRDVTTESSNRRQVETISKNRGPGDAKSSNRKQVTANTTKSTYGSRDKVEFSGGRQRVKSSRIETSSGRQVNVGLLSERKEDISSAMRDIQSVRLPESSSKTQVKMESSGASERAISSEAHLEESIIPESSSSGSQDKEKLLGGRRRVGSRPPQLVEFIRESSSGSRTKEDSPGLRKQVKPGTTYLKESAIPESSSGKQVEMESAGRRKQAVSSVTQLGDPFIPESLSGSRDEKQFFGRLLRGKSTSESSSETKDETEIELTGRMRSDLPQAYPQIKAELFSGTPRIR